MSDFWSKNFADTTTPIKDPKRKFRFKVSITGLTGTEADGSTVWFAKTATKPSFQVAAAEHKYLNHTFYYPGTVTWQDVTITLVDPTSPDVADAFGAIMAAAKYGIPDDDSSFTTMTKSSAAGALGSVVITQLDGDGGAIETWTLHNAFITEFKFGDLEYGGDDLTELSMTLKYDWATMVGAGDSAETRFDTIKDE